MTTIAAQGAGGPVIDLAELIDRQSVTIFNVLIIAIGWFAIFGDGFDISVIGYVMPNIMREFHLGPETVGLVNSSSLAAYPIGALVLGWISDRHGRRLGLILGCLIVSIFTFAAVGVHTAGELAFTRFCTGVGLGGVIPNIVALSAEFAPKRLRARLVIFTFCGINFGGFVSGLIAPPIIAAWGWQGLFVVGGAIPFVAVILMWFFMPESIKFLALNGKRDAELRQTLSRLVPNEAIPEGARFAVASVESRIPFKPRQLFEGTLKWITPVLWTAFILNFMVIYFTAAWTNIILQSSGNPCLFAQSGRGGTGRTRHQLFRRPLRLSGGDRLGCPHRRYGLGDRRAGPRCRLDCRLGGDLWLRHARRSVWSQCQPRIALSNIVPRVRHRLGFQRQPDRGGRRADHRRLPRGAKADTAAVVLCSSHSAGYRHRAGGGPRNAELSPLPQLSARRGASGSVMR
jgi:MFS family permease